MIAVFFAMFSTSALKGKSGNCLLLALSIGDDWMVDLMMISIKKTFAKPLDLTTLSTFIWKCMLDESKSLNK